jgi:hypothetical protein
MIGRRSVLQLLTALGAVGTVGSGAAAGPDDAGATNVTSPTDIAARQDQPVGTEALLSYLEAKYGDMLTEENLATLEEEVAGHLGAAEGLDDASLGNGDDMALRFEPYRGSWD